MGMCGAYNSILGDDIADVITRLRTGMYEPLKVCDDNEYLIQGVILDLGTKNTISRLNKIIKL